VNWDLGFGFGLWDLKKQPSQKLIGSRRCEVAENAAIKLPHTPDG
jgi:hypothetical protein